MCFSMTSVGMNMLWIWWTKTFLAGLIHKVQQFEKLPWFRHTQNHRCVIYLGKHKADPHFYGNVLFYSTDNSLQRTYLQHNGRKPSRVRVWTLTQVNINGLAVQVPLVNQFNSTTLLLLLIKPQQLFSFFVLTHVTVPTLQSLYSAVIYLPVHDSWIMAVSFGMTTSLCAVVSRQIFQTSKTISSSFNPVPPQSCDCQHLSDTLVLDKNL